MTAPENDGPEITVSDSGVVVVGEGLAALDLGGMLIAERDALAAKVERLTEALRTIAETKPHHAGATPNEHHMRETARAALEST